jgi:hypothetical protein
MSISRAINFLFYNYYNIDRLNYINGQDLNNSRKTLIFGSLIVKREFYQLS